MGFQASPRVWFTTHPFMVGAAYLSGRCIQSWFSRGPVGHQLDIAETFR